MSKKSESASRGDSLDSTMTSLKVAVRVRPLNDKEINLGSKIVVDVLGNDIVITDLKVPEHQGYDHRSRIHNFSFDYGFSSVDPSSEHYASQATVFENFGRVVLQALLEGYNCCVIAYGQSGSGKTYTMMGMKNEEGLTPRLCEGLLMKLEDKAKQNISFAVNISYMEIYNEQVYDLLDERTNQNKPRLRVREHPIHGPFVEGLSTHVLKSRDNVCKLISEGNDNRIKAATYIHERSSRSHAIFTIHCSQACLDESQPKEVVSKLQLVDLAGSEKAGHEFCQSRLKEGASINKSLVTLGNVISALVELSQRLQNGACKSGKQLFVPYRDSQLTWLMKDSLGGNSHTFMLAAISPSKECYSETISTLRYAQRAKNVLNVPIVNEDPATKIIRNLRLEVNKLKSLLVNADVLSKKSAMKPLPNISHLNNIMKKSEKKVDHLTKRWFEKWLETYNSVIKETDYLYGESPHNRTGTEGVLQSAVAKLTAEGTNVTLCDSNLNYSVRHNPSDSSLSLKTINNDDVAFSDKSSSVSSECIILPNEIIFYSRGKRNNKDQKHVNNFNLKSISSSHVCNGNYETTILTDKNGTSSNPMPKNHCHPVTSGIPLYKNVFKSLPVLNYLSAASSVQNSFFIQEPLFNCSSLPKDIQILPAHIATIAETDKKGFNSEKYNVEIDNRVEKMCEENIIYRTGEEVIPNVADNCNLHRSDNDMRSQSNNEKNLEQKDRNGSCEECISTYDHNMSIEKTDKSSSMSEDIHDKKCSTGTLIEFTDCINMYDHNASIEKTDKSSSVDKDSHDKKCSTGALMEFTDCKLMDDGKKCEEIQFNDSVAEESNNFVKLLNRMQDGSAEIVNPCFHRKDSEILSLLSLSSNDFPPFQSLDDIFNDDDDDDDMGASDETGNFDFDVLSESRQQFMAKGWSELCSSSDVTDGSDSSDAESEFDYLDFTKNTAGTCSKAAIESSEAINRYQNFKDLKFIVKTSDIKESDQSENLLGIVEVSCEHVDSPLLAEKSSLTDSTHNIITSEQKDHSSIHSDFNENEDTINISANRKEGSLTAYLKEKPLSHKRLWNSDSIIKSVPRSEIKYSSKSDNIIYAVSKGNLNVSKPSDANEEKECQTFHKNTVNNDINEKMLFTNKDSVSNLSDFSLQDILDMINGKGITHSGVAQKEKIYSGSEEKFQYNSAIPEEIQKFIDSTEITDANKLADELLKKKIFECTTPVVCSPKNSDLVLNSRNDQNKLSKPKFHSAQSDINEKTYCSADNTKMSKGSGAVTCSEVEVEKINRTQENVNFTPLKKLHTAVEEVHCENENALEFFVFNEYKEFSMDPISNDNLENVASIMSASKSSSACQQINDGKSSSLVTKKTANSELSSEVNAELFNPHFHDFVTESPDDNINSVNSQMAIFTDYNTFGNLNITSLTPIEEEAIEDEAMSDVSEDDSPNISFQFDSLERPKNTLMSRNCLPCGEPSCTTGTISDNEVNVVEPEKFSNMVINDPKTFYDKNSDFFTRTCIGTEEEDNENVELSFNKISDGEMSYESLNAKSMLTFSSPLGHKERSENSPCGASCEGTNQFRFLDTENNGLLLNKENTDMCATSEGNGQNVGAFKNELDVKINCFDEVNNLSSQLCSWDSSSSTTSSDSITFVFVGKENKDIALNNSSRSFQSSLFSSVSLDSLEKSSVHQNQVSCISPRTLSIDSLVAEELLFQLRNSDPIQPLTSETKQYTGNKGGEMSNTIDLNQKLESKKTNFVATSQLNCNEHLKMHRYTHCDVENDLFFQSVAPEISDKEKCENKNSSSNINRNKKIIFHPNTSSDSCSENVSDKQFENHNENYSCVNSEVSVDGTEQSCNYLKSNVGNKYQTDKNVRYSTSDDCIKESHREDSSETGPLNHIIKEENIFTSSCITESHYNCTDFGSNNSNVLLNNGSVTASSKSLEHLILNNCTDMQKQMLLPENVRPKENRFCDNYVQVDHHDELFSVKELTEENLKIFNSEFEENREDVYILPPPSTFDVSEDNGLSVISSSFSLVGHPSKTMADVFSKATQTEQSSQNECNKLSEKDNLDDTENSDLIVRMMDLMVETLKLMKEQYSRTPKRSSQPRKKLEFFSESDKDTSDQKQMAITSAAAKHRRYLTKDTDERIVKYMQTVLPVSCENDYVSGSFSHPMTHPELPPYSKKNVHEHSMNIRNRLIHDDSKTGCSTAKKPNFYTLPFDFITSKYKSKKPSELKKADALSQVSVDCFSNKDRNLKSTNNEFSNVSAFISASAAEHKQIDAKQNCSRPSKSKSHLQHLIELRRKVVEATMCSSNGTANVNFENHITDPLKSPSSSSEGYLSSVSSRGPFRQFSEVSTDSQESNPTMEHLLPKPCPQKHSVRPLDFSSQCYRDVAVSPDTRWMNTSADSGAFFLDSPGIEKKSNVEDYPNITSNCTDIAGTGSSVACTSSKMHDMESSRRDCNIIGASMNQKEVKVPSPKRVHPRDETKQGRRQHQQHCMNDSYAPGFQDLDDIGENYMDISLKGSASVCSSNSSDFSFNARRPSRNRNSPHSRVSKSSPRLKRRLSGQEIEKLLESIENDKRVLRQIQQNHVLDRKYSPSHILPSSSSLENFDDLFYQDCYKSLPTHCSVVAPMSHKV